MKKEITPEMYNYNKFPGPRFEKVLDHIQSQEIDFVLIENYKEAFDLTAFEQRFISYLLKFDYIVGDWGNEQLRLKGFYKDENTSQNSLKISRLEDYLLEHCNYGCAYFVLENPVPQEPLKEDEEDPRPERRHRRRFRSNRPGQTSRKPEAVVEKPVSREGSGEKKTRQRRRQKPKQEKRHFEIKTDKEKQEKKQVKKDVQSSKREFVIRQK